MSHHSEKFLIRKIHEFQVILMNKYHTPTSFIYLDKKKMKFHGSEKLTSFMKRNYENSGDFKKACKEDLDEMCSHTETDRVKNLGISSKREPPIG